MTPAQRAAGWLTRRWWQPVPGMAARLLQLLSWVYRCLFERMRRGAAAQRAPVPVLVVGNIVVGGAGKTPTVIAVVAALRALGHRPGVVSRGHGRRGVEPAAVLPRSTPRDVGDAPLLIARRADVPVWVARDRAGAARALSAAHPDVDVIVADDGLQHHALARDAELLVFDERGIGNGLLLPAGPLREPLPRALKPTQRVLYSAGARSTALSGALAERRIAEAWPLAAWHAVDARSAVPLATLRGQPLLAAAGIAAPEKFFVMLEAAGLSIQRLPLPDHHDFAALPWPASTAAVITTEKDAVKLAPERCGATRVWVVPLDLALPAALAGELEALLFPKAAPGTAYSTRP